MAKKSHKPPDEAPAPAPQAPSNVEIVHSDLVNYAPQLDKGSIQTLFWDPPYNFKVKYDECDDDLEHDEYLAKAEHWFDASKHLLTRTGSMFLVVPDRIVSEMDLLARKIMVLKKRCHIIWTYTFGNAAARNFTPSHVHILYFAKSLTKCKFNADAVRVPSARQLKYGDKRANPKGKLPDTLWMLLKEQIEKELGPGYDTWLESRVCGTFNERLAHVPNQLPLPIVERAVLATTDPGDTVADFFLGTGTTARACILHGRHFFGCDLSAAYVQAAKDMIDAFRKNRGG